MAMSMATWPRLLCTLLCASVLASSTVAIVSRRCGEAVVPKMRLSGFTGGWPESYGMKLWTDRRVRADRGCWVSAGLYANVRRL
jgi:hypothetical protein